ncbi:hypothetical protein WCE02_09540 [Pseudomonas juntendi]|uniref:hypothetical protein n=1 Tax=Pseudomonas TaxID=286 RepID=UPI0034D4908E
MSEARSFINPKTQTYETLKSNLSLSGYSAAKFDILNAHIFNSVVSEGELVIVGDFSTPSCTSHEAFLMAEASNIHTALVLNDVGSDGFFLENFDFLKSLLGYASLGVGVVSDAWSKHMKEIKDTLVHIENAYQEYLHDKAPEARNRFYMKRADLFSTLRKQLKNIAAYGSGLRRDASVKRLLNISTKRYLHAGEIKGYAEKVDGVAKATKFLKKGFYVGMSFDVMSTALSINKACTLGREGECSKATYVEGGALIGGMSGASIGGMMGSTAGKAACLAIGVSSLGTGALACSIIGAAGGAVLAGEIGNDFGGKIGLRLYDDFLN